MSERDVRSSERESAATSGFFADRQPGRPGLALFLNAGDPPLDVLINLIRMLDEERIDCLELAVPFPNSPTDGKVIRRSAQRALDAGMDLDTALAFLAELNRHLRHIKIALLVDWSHSIKGTSLREFLERTKAAGAHGVLVHGLPPRLRGEYYDAAREVGQPIVTTCYANSEPEVLAEAAEHGSAYIYLVAHYGRSGDVAPPEPSELRPIIERLRSQTQTPIAVGFGVKDRSHVDALDAIGADAAIVGSTCVARIGSARMNRRDIVEDFRDLLVDLGYADPAPPKPAAEPLTTAPS
jgi:tryptophan synthase alpha chain